MGSSAGDITLHPVVSLLCILPRCGGRPRERGGVDIRISHTGHYIPKLPSNRGVTQCVGWQLRLGTNFYQPAGGRQYTVSYQRVRLFVY
jgi:hypothetical protein